MTYEDRFNALWATHGGRTITSLLASIARDGREFVPGIAAVVVDVLRGTPDFGAAARSAGWYYDREQSEWRIGDAESSDGYRYAATADLACRADGIEVPVPDDAVLDHAPVSPWLARQLDLHGERVAEVGGVRIWVRDGSTPVMRNEAIMSIASDYDPDAPAPEADDDYEAPRVLGL